MSLKRIEEKGKKADELWEKIYGEKKPEDDGKEKTEDKDKALETDEKPADKKPEDKPQDQKPEDEKPEPKPEPKPEDDFKHKYEVLKGKYDSEVPRLAFELAEATRGVGELKKEIEELKKPKPEPEKPKEDNPILKKFKEEYPEIYEGSNALIDELVKEKLSRVDEISGKVGKIEEGMGTVKEDIGKSDRERYLSKLDADESVGREWRILNKNTEFNAWLEETEPYTGFKKYDLLMDAWNKMDHQRTLEIFKIFKAIKKIKASGPDEKKVDIKDDDIHPPKGQKATDGGKKDNVPTATTEDLKKFTKDVIEGKWKGREAEAEKEEQRILMGLGIKPKQT